MTTEKQMISKSRCICQILYISQNEKSIVTFNSIDKILAMCYILLILILVILTLVKLWYILQLMVRHCLIRGYYLFLLYKITLYLTFHGNLYSRTYGNNMWHNEVSEDYIQYGALCVRLKQLKLSNFIYEHVCVTILCVSKGVLKKFRMVIPSGGGSQIDEIWKKGRWKLLFEFSLVSWIFRLLFNISYFNNNINYHKSNKYIYNT